MTAIDATARVADSARIGGGVEIGPYCLVGPHVELKGGVRLVAHVNVTGDTTIDEGTVVYPFASLGTAPQSVHYHGEPTKLVIAAATLWRMRGMIRGRCSSLAGNVADNCHAGTDRKNFCRI